MCCSPRHSTGLSVTPHHFFQSDIIAWIGVLFCLAGLLLFLWSLISFRQSFRVGIDADHPDRLITDGVFCLQSQSHLCGLCDYLDRRILHLPELDNFDCSGRGRMAAPPSSLARRRIFGRSLRPSLRGVSPPRSKISLKHVARSAVPDRPLGANSAVSALRVTIPAVIRCTGASPFFAVAWSKIVWTLPLISPFWNPHVSRILQSPPCAARC